MAGRLTATRRGGAPSGGVRVPDVTVECGPTASGGPGSRVMVPGPAGGARERESGGVDRAPSAAACERTHMRVGGWVGVVVGVCVCVCGGGGE